MIIQTDLQLKLEHLRRVVIKENQYLKSTAKRLSQADPNFLWLDNIENNEDLAERLDAFVSRFCRLQDTLGDKLLPVHLQSSTGTNRHSFGQPESSRKIRFDSECRNLDRSSHFTKQFNT